MDTKQLLILLIVLAFVGFRIYQKYIKKDQANKDTKADSGSSFPSSRSDDDYEPYSKK